MEQINHFKQVAFILLKGTDGKYKTHVPLYVKVKEVQSNGLTETQEEILDRVSKAMIKHHEQQLREFIQCKKEGKEYY